MCKPFIVRDSGDLAQLVERLVRNEKVRGSNPLISTTSGKKKLRSPRVHLLIVPERCSIPI